MGRMNKDLLSLVIGAYSSELQFKDIVPIKLADESLLEKSIDDGENPVLHLQIFVYGAFSMIHIPWAWNAKCVVIFMQSFFQFLSPIANKYHEGKKKKKKKKKS